MDKENITLAGKWMELADHHVEQGKPNSKSQILHVLTYSWILGFWK
jgi:hypothetical protein